MGRISRINCYKYQREMKFIRISSGGNKTVLLPLKGRRRAGSNSQQHKQVRWLEEFTRGTDTYTQTLSHNCPRDRIGGAVAKELLTMARCLVNTGADESMRDD